MKRYILTGTPGAGKTTILRALESAGQAVVEEAATDVIAKAHRQGEPQLHERPDFIDRIVALQRRRQMAARGGANIQFFDRSPICTHALSVWLGYPISAALEAELVRIQANAIYERRVFFIDNLGFVEPTLARRITFADALAFERVHQESYRAFGYELIRVPVAGVEDRARAILALALG